MVIGLYKPVLVGNSHKANAARFASQLHPSAMNPHFANKLHDCAADLKACWNNPLNLIANEITYNDGLSSRRCNNISQTLKFTNYAVTGYFLAFTLSIN